MCCGRAKIQSRFHSAAQSPVARNHSAVSLPGPTFEYVGTTALTVFGPVSGAPYRFSNPGSRVRVDPRDRQSLAGVPVLRLVPC